MNAPREIYQIWIDWEQAIASFHPISGYERIRFDSEENYQAKVHILVQAGFRFQ